MATTATLIAKTRKGRMRIKTAGTDKVELLRTGQDLPIGRGTWEMVQFVGTDISRWVNIHHDVDFKLTQVQRETV